MIWAGPAHACGTSSGSDMELEREKRESILLASAAGQAPLKWTASPTASARWWEGEIVEIILNWHNGLCAALNVMPIRDHL